MLGSKDDSTLLAVDEIRNGRFLVLVDGEGGDLVIAAQFVTPQVVNFMAKHARGLIRLSLTDQRCDELALVPMTGAAARPIGEAFTVPIEARDGTTSGVSAADRARTIQLAIDPTSRPQQFIQRGHVFPVRAAGGGVLRRAGAAEASVDLAQLAGLSPAAVICQIMNDDGTVARAPDLKSFAEQHRLRTTTVGALIEHRHRTERLIERGASVALPTPRGQFTAVAFHELLTGKHHVALVLGKVDGRQDVLVRVHSECLTGDVFRSLRCDCGPQLDAALTTIATEGRGVVLYMAQEGRGIGLLNKLKAYALQDQGFDTVDANLALGFAADERDWGIGNQILAELGLSTIRLLTNNPKKVAGLGAFGLTVTEQVPLEVAPNAQNIRYLSAKRDRLGHSLRHQDLDLQRLID